VTEERNVLNSNIANAQMNFEAKYLSIEKEKEHIEATLKINTESFQAEIIGLSNANSLLKEELHNLSQKINASTSNSSAPEDGDMEVLKKALSKKEQENKVCFYTNKY
jgi:hypothetical protein